jgi:hypothetical protein
MGQMPSTMASKRLRREEDDDDDEWALCVSDRE